MRRLLLLALLAGALVWLTGAPASAHASLISSDPEDGSVVATLPDQLVLTFNEPVRVEADAVTGFLADGSDWELAAVAQDNRVVLTPATDPGEGTVVVAWQVTSEDGHVVSGAVTFSVGTPSAGGAAAVAAPDPPASVTAARWVAGGVAGLGLVAALALTLAGRRPDPAWHAGFAAAVLLAPLHELADDGRGLGGLADWLAWIDGVTRPASLLLLAAYAVAAAARSTSRRLLAAAVAVPALVLAGGAAYSWPERAEPVAAATGGPVTSTAELGDVGTVTLTAARGAGRALELTLELPVEPFAPPTLTLRRDEVSLGDTALTATGPTTYTGAVTVPTDGTWEAQVSVRTSEFDNPVAVLELEVGAAPSGAHEPGGDHAE